MHQEDDVYFAVMDMHRTMRLIDTQTAMHRYVKTWMNEKKKHACV